MYVLLAEGSVDRPGTVTQNTADENWASHNPGVEGRGGG